MPLVVRGTPYSCWRCGPDDVAVAVIHLDGFARAHEVITTEAGLSLAYAAELLAAAGHAQAVTIKVRRSRAARRAYLSNGCIRCDSLFGQFPVSEDVTSMLASDAVSTLPALVTVEGPAIEWYAVIGLSATSDNLA